MNKIDPTGRFPESYSLGSIAEQGLWDASDFMDYHFSESKKGKNKEKTNFVQLPANGVGYTSYSGSDHLWGTPNTINSLKTIFANWAKNHTSLIQIGDISKKDGGKFPGHKSHQKGIDLDIRPMRKDGKVGPTGIGNSTYSRDVTREVIKTFLADSNTSLIFFNDSELIKEFKNKVKYWVNHNDHLHVRFKS